MLSVAGFPGIFLSVALLKCLSFVEEASQKRRAAGNVLCAWMRLASAARGIVMSAARITPGGMPRAARGSLQP